jgi:two-component system chemotaxis response regulator CheY
MFIRFFCSIIIIIVGVRIKLVIVDDAPFIREVVKNLVAGSSIDVVGEARDGNQAVEVVLETRPDVVLMDIVMPHKSGIEATQEIMKALPNTRIIACSTSDQESVIMRALDAGCCHYVVKPFKAQELLKAILSSAQPPAEKIT